MSAKRDVERRSGEELWERLRRFTPARIGLGRVGDGLPTKALLDFELAHARARDAVHAELDAEALTRAIRAGAEQAPEVLVVASEAKSRSAFLQRPDLGARLCAADRDRLEPAGADLCFVLGDGLSAAAVSRHGPPTLRAALHELRDFSVAPIVIARQARVALADEIGERLGARVAVILIGERPGLSAADSLGAYLTFEPRRGRANSERNCISNIRSAGLPPEAAGTRIAALVRDALRLGLSGVGLKDRSAALPSGLAGSGRLSG